MSLICDTIIPYATPVRIGQLGDLVIGRAGMALTKLVRGARVCGIMGDKGGPVLPTIQNVLGGRAWYTCTINRRRS